MNSQGTIYRPFFKDIKENKDEIVANLKVFGTTIRPDFFKNGFGVVWSMNDTLNYTVHLGGFDVHYNSKFMLRNPSPYLHKHDFCYYFLSEIPAEIEKFGNDIFANQVAQARNSNIFLSIHGDAEIDFESAEADYVNTMNMFASLSLTSNYY